MKNSTMKRLSTALLGSLLVLGLASTALAERKAEPGPIGGTAYTTGRDLASCPVTEFDRLSPDKQAAVSRLMDQRDRDVAGLGNRLDSKKAAMALDADRVYLDSFVEADQKAEIEGLEARIAARDERFRKDVAVETGNPDLGGALLASLGGTNCEIR